MTSTYKLLIDFIKQPYNEIIETSWQQKMILSAKLIYFYFAAALVLALCVALPLTLLLEKNGIEIVNLASPENLYARFGKYTLLIVGLIVPIVEECMFRLPLSFKKRDILLSIVAILGYIVLFIDSSFFILSAIVLCGGLVFYLLARQKQEGFDKVKGLYGKYILYFSIILFAVAHLTNFESFEISLLPIYLLFLTPLFVMSLIITFVRMRMGFIFAVLFHILNNTVVILLGS